MKERRKERLAALIQEELPRFFRDELELEPGVFVSILYVETVKTGTKANVFVSIYPDTARVKVARELKISENKATHFIRKLVASKYSPAIRFQLAR